MRHRPLYIIFFFFILYIITLNWGCEKEYSYEGGPIRDSTVADSTIITDSTGPVSIIFPICSGCNSTNTLAASKWSFKTGNSLLCGNITRGVLSPDGDGMTFFGPSTCSLDTGLIITAFFENTILNKDLANLKASHASLEYYDNTTNLDILQSKPPNIFSLTIDNYVRQTGIATGTFSGSVLDKKGNIIKVTSGKFNVKF